MPETVQEIRSRYEQTGGGEFQADGRFALVNCTLKEGKSGSFATVEMRDPSGSLTARCFDAAGVEQLATAKGFLEARLRISPFNNNISAVIQSFRLVEADADELLRYAGLDPEAHAQRVEEAKGYLDETRGTVYGDVLEALFSGGVWEQFTMAPAAVRMHHAEPGGLVRHICEVARAGLGLLDSTREPYDRPYFLAGVFLHDIGKLDTYTAPPTIAYTAQGQLGEHQIWSTFRLAKACAVVGVPASIESRLLHIIEQAHGAYRHAEWQDPLGVEAKALATADFFSSRLGITDKERRAQDALDLLLTSDSATVASAESPGAAEDHIPGSPEANLFHLA